MSIHQHLEIDIATIKFMSEEREDVNFDFRASLNGQDPDKIDRIVHERIDKLIEQNYRRNPLHIKN